MKDASRDLPEEAEPWWVALYGDEIAQALLERADANETERTIDFLWRILELRPGVTVFDQCCGIGSLAVPLARRDVRVVGCDLGRGYVERARTDAERVGVEVDLVCADAFDFVPDRPCAAAFNWWTSYGYAEHDDQNLEMLRRAYEALEPGGRFALDFMNVPGVLRDFQPVVVTRRMRPEGELKLVRTSEVDLEHGVMLKRWSWTLPDGSRREHDSRVRLYQPWTLREQLRAAGFCEIVLLGDLRGAVLGLDSPRCIAIGRRPA